VGGRPRELEGRRRGGAVGMAGRGQPTTVEGGAGWQEDQRETRMRTWMEKIKEGRFAYMCDHRRGMDQSGTT
jgi:hypothetical protein